VKKIAFFDFDGTLTHEDSMFSIVRFVHGNLGFYWGMLQLSPFLIAFKLGLMGRKQIKELYLKHFFGGMPVEEFQSHCEAFSETILPKILRKEGLAKLQWHQRENHEVVLVSASAQNWLSQWCRKQQIHCIATKLEEEAGRLTGKLDGENCHGEEKVRRIQEIYDLSTYEEVYAYGDTSGDKPMLAMANQAFYRVFQK
jgi:HAD superfamily hydrolase (TIGR01490 family)